MIKTLKRCGLGLLLSAALLAGGCSAGGSQARAAFSVTAAESWALALEEAALTVLDTLYDDYAAYFTEEEFQIMLDDYYGAFAGVGVQLTQDEDDNTVVYAVLPGYSAMENGVEMDDRIIAIDGESVIGYDLNQVVARLRGDEGTSVQVTLLRQSGGDWREISVTLTRAWIESSSLEGELLTGYPGVAYISIFDFTEQTPLEFANLFNTLSQEQEIAALILDLRSNGGGSFYAAVDLADYFVPRKEVIVWEKTYGGEIYYRSGGGALQDLPVVVLQNEYTASASEVFIGALRDYGNTQIVGVTSYGKGITQVLSYLPDGGGLRYTQSRYYTPLKYDLHGVGLEPDYWLENEGDDVTYEAYFDPYHADNLHMQKALELLSDVWRD